MSHSVWLFCALILSMAVILFLILKVKLNAAIALVLGSILMGILSGISTLETINGINEGFGSMLKGMGLPIGFGIILGELVSASGGAKVIADVIVKAFPKTKSIYAIGLAAFVLAIPVYFDVTFVNSYSNWNGSYERNPQVHCPCGRSYYHWCGSSTHYGAAYSGSPGRR